MAVAPSDAEKVEQAYRRRAAKVERRRYSPFNLTVLHRAQERERAFVKLLARHNVRDLEPLDVLEVGCGSGGELARLIVLGASPDRLSGIELRAAAAAEAAARVRAKVVAGDASAMPFATASFDLVLQLTAFSSMPSAAMRDAVAREMVRVTRPGGLIVSYDFTWNPRNEDTVGITLDELRRLFPRRRIDARRITLAPPLARKAGPVPGLGRLLGAVPWLRSHLIAAIEI